MNIKKIVSVAVLAAIFALGSVSQAHAEFFDNSSGWSFNDIYQSIQNIPVNPTDISGAIQSDSVNPTNAPVLDSVKTQTKVLKTYLVSVTAYTSSPDETDSTPFITADGSYVHDGIVAANFLPFGTAIKIPSLYGDKVFVVKDRMNSRYWMNVDVWMTSKNIAKQFGRKTVKIEVVS